MSLGGGRSLKGEADGVEELDWVGSDGDWIELDWVVLDWIKPT